MLLSYNELVELVEAKVITAKIENINGASIDLTLDDSVLIEKYQVIEPVIRLSDKQAPEMIALTINDQGFILKPKQFMLASTREVFNLPSNIAAEFKLKSSLARAGLNHCLAGFADPSWYNSRLTLELYNVLQFNSLLLTKGMKIGQMLFYRVNEVPEANSYAAKGRYNNTITVTGSKGV